MPVAAEEVAPAAAAVVLSAGAAATAAEEAESFFESSSDDIGLVRQPLLVAKAKGCCSSPLPCSARTPRSFTSCRGP